MATYIGHREKAEFQRKGYWISPVLFRSSEIERIRSAIERIYEGDLDPGTSWPFVEPVGTDIPGAIKTALFTWTVSSDIRQTICDDRLTHVAKSLLGASTLRIWQDQAIWKPGTATDVGEDGNIGFHQDYAYWQDSSTTNMISANIALQDVSAENGCLRVLEGSHKQGLIHGLGDFFDTDIQKSRSEYKNRLPQHEEKILEMTAGQVSFHHSLLVHGSGPNRTDTPRLVLAPAYTPGETFYRDEDQEPCPHSDLIGKDKVHGQLFDGEYFPLLP